MSLGNVLGGVADGYKSTTSQLDALANADTAAEDAHDAALNKQNYLKGMAVAGQDARARHPPDGTPIGATSGDAQPVADWLTDRGIDPSVLGSATTPEQIRSHPIFGQTPTSIPPYSAWSAGAAGQAPSAIPTSPAAAPTVPARPSAIPADGQSAYEAATIADYHPPIGDPAATAAALHPTTGALLDMYTRMYTDAGFPASMISQNVRKSMREDGHPLPNDTDPTSLTSPLAP